MNVNSFAFHAMIEGRVQGVGFRYFVLRTAESMGVVGWVRNRYGGQVEVLAEGEKGQLEKLITALHHGPPSSVVAKVEVDWRKASGKFKSFSVRLSR